MSKTLWRGAEGGHGVISPTACAEGPGSRRGASLISNRKEDFAWRGRKKPQVPAHLWGFD